MIFQFWSYKEKIQKKNIKIKAKIYLKNSIYKLFKLNKDSTFIININYQFETTDRK